MSKAEAKEKEVTTTPAIYAAISGVMRDCGAVGKNGRNESSRYSFRAWTDLADKVNPAMVKNRIILQQNNVEIERTERMTKSGSVNLFVQMTITYRLIAIDDGSSLTYIVKGEGADVGDKAINKAQTSCWKNLVNAAFCPPFSAADDSETDTPEFAPQAPETEAEIIRKSELLAEIIKLAEIAGITMDQLASINKGSAISDLPVERLEKCTAWLRKQAKDKTMAELKQTTEEKQHGVA